MKIQNIFIRSISQDATIAIAKECKKKNLDAIQQAL
jgi:hypothetical protein